MNSKNQSLSARKVKSKLFKNELLSSFLDIFYFQYSKNDEIVEFSVTIDDTKSATIFDKEFIKVLGQQLINLKYLGESLCGPFFPDINMEIVQKIDETDNAPSFALKMFESSDLKIIPNSAKTPIFIEFVAPGTPCL